MGALNSTCTIEKTNNPTEQTGTPAEHNENLIDFLTASFFELLVLEVTKKETEQGKHTAKNPR